MKTAFLSLGSNLGDREGHLAEALQRLEAAGVHVKRRFSIYETEPRDVLNQPWFLNLVVEVGTDLFPIQLLNRLQKIEREMGRRRLTPKGPRTIDIDILLFGNAAMNTETLRIPHPGLIQRRFVLEPLIEVAPELRHPETRQRLADLREAVAGQVVRKWRSSK